ncbi:hypothetical protein ASL83_003388 [Vibrio parahaemolyticus]|nr:hypothetical protein [Vibrio parahaemolyticus]
MVFTKKLGLAMMLSTSFIAHHSSATSLDLDSPEKYLRFSEGVYDESSNRVYAAQCNKNPKAAEMMAVTKLSKYLASSTITSSETAPPATFHMTVSAELKAFRPDYSTVANQDFNGYHCYLVSTLH